MLTKEAIRTLLKRLDGEPADALEDEQLEFKLWETDPKAFSRTLRETVVCLANARGGTLVFGVRDRVRSRREAIQGVGYYDLAQLRRAVYDGTDPHILVEIEELQESEGTLLLVHVPRGLPPHTTSDGVAKIRVGKECKPLTGRMLTSLLASGGQRDPTAEAVQGVTESDLDPIEIEELRKIIRREAQSARLAQLDSHALLSALGLVSPHGVSMAGLLLIGRAEVIAHHLPQHEVTFLRYQSPTRYDQRHDLRGPLLSVLRELEHLLAANNRITTIQEAGFGQFEVPVIPWEVAREAILNALTHRDYFLRQSIQLALSQDRLEIISPGGFIGGISPENVLRHPPVHRNELLARVFQTVGLVNRVGLGVDRMYEGLLRLGKAIPHYTADEGHVRLVIALNTAADFALFIAQEERRGQSFDLDDLLILRAFEHKPYLDRWSAARLLQLPEEGAISKLIRLRQSGYLSVQGRGRGARYGLGKDLVKFLQPSAFGSPGSFGSADFPLEEEAAQQRVLSVLGEQGRLTNAHIRQLSGLSRTQVYQLVKKLVVEGKVQYSGKGRAAHIVLAK